jgi:cardiolipin synthase
VDDTFVTFGSINFDNRSFSINDEVNVNVIDRTTARAFQKSFQADLAKSTPLSLAAFRARPFYIKAADQFCGIFRALF